MSTASLVIGWSLSGLISLGSALKLEINFKKSDDIDEI